MIKQRRVVVYMPEQDYRRLKVKLAMLGKTLSGWFREKVYKLLVSD